MTSLQLSLTQDRSRVRCAALVPLCPPLMTSAALRMGLPLVRARLMCACLQHLHQSSVGGAVMPESGNGNQALLLLLLALALQNYPLLV